MIRRSILLLHLVTGAPVLAEVSGVPLIDGVPHMVTTGEAIVEVEADQADLGVTVRLERKTADEAVDAVGKAADAVIVAIGARGVSAGDIHTSVDLVQTFDTKKDERDRAGRTPRSYEASKHITVRLHDSAKVGLIARDIIRSGVALVPSIVFSYSKEAQRRRDLDAEAMRDALQQAKVYTDAVGLKLGPVLEITRDPIAARQPVQMSDGASGSDGVPLPIDPAPLRLREGVTVVWEIEGRAH